MFRAIRAVSVSVYLGVVLVGALVAAPSVMAAGENREGWDLLLDNKPFEARAAFEKNVSRPDRRVAGEAKRGLSRVARFLGQDIDASRLVYEAFQLDGDTLALAASKTERMEFANNWNGYSLQAARDVHAALETKPSLLTAPLASELLRRHLNDGNAGKSAQLAARLGVVRDWWVIGPFSNVSGSGFDKVYPPETSDDLARTYEGRNGNKVAWFPLRNPGYSSWIFIQNHLPFGNAVIYFAAGVESPVERRALLAFGTSGSFKVFLNDRVVLADRVFRNTDEDAYVQEVTLRKGMNRLLVKLGNEEQYSNFQLRFADSAGVALQGLKIVKPEGAYPAEGGAAERPARMPNVERLAEYFGRRLALDPSDEEAAILLWSAYGLADQNDSAEALGLKRLDRRPGSAFWHQALGETMTRSRQTTRAQEYFKSAQRLSADNFMGWSYELGRMTQSAGSEATLEFLKNSPPHLRSSVIGQVGKLGHQAQLGRSAEVMSAFAEIEKRSDYDLVSANMRARVYLAQGSKGKAEGAWRRFLEHERVNSVAYNTLASLQVDGGDVSGALKTLAEGRKHIPADPNMSLSQANLHLQNKRYAEAEKALAGAETLAPMNSVVLQTKANLLELMGRKDEAKKILQRNLEYNYNDFAALDKLRELDGLPSFQTLAPLPPVDSLLRAAEGWEGLKRERGSLVSIIEDLFFYPNRAVAHRHFMVLHLPTQEAVNRTTRYDISYNGSYQTLTVGRALTRKKAGTEVDAELNGNVVVFKSLEPGDAVVLEWTLKDDYPEAMARQAWGQFTFRLPLPVYDARLRFYMAGSDTVGYEVRGSGVRVESGEKGAVKTRVFTHRPLALAPGEVFVPVNDTTTPDVVFSTFSDWGRIADWYADLTENKSSATPSLQRLADSLFRGAKTDAEKIARVHRFVATSIAYSSLSFRQSGWVPQMAQEVLASRLGDCKDKAALAKSLLDIAGIRSHLVLVATRDQYGTRPGPIGPHFNHCILAYILNGKEHFMELTDPETYWTRLSKFDQGAVALVARKGNRSLIRLPVDGPGQRYTRRDLRFTLSENGDVSITSQTFRRGLHAAGIRESYRHLSDEERRTSMLQALASDYSDVSLDSVWFGDLDPAADSVSYGYRYGARQAVKAQGKTRIFSLALPDEIEGSEIPGAGTGREGLDLYRARYSMGTYSQTGSIAYPAGWKLLEVPQPVTVESPYGSYSLVFQAQGNTLRYTRKAAFRFDNNVPANESDAARTFLTRVVQGDDVQLLFTKP